LPLAGAPPPHVAVLKHLGIPKTCKEQAIKNSIFLHEEDFARFDAATARASETGVLVKIKRDDGTGLDWILAAEKVINPDVKPGYWYSTKFTRKDMDVEMDIPCRLEGYDMSKVTPIQTLRLSVRVVSGEPKLPMKAEALAKNFLVHCQNLVVAPGQTLLAAKMQGKLYVSGTVEGFDVVKIPGAAPFDDRFGSIITNTTAILPYSADPTLMLLEEDPLALGDEPEEAEARAPKQLFNSEFDFAKLGIGGLGAEFDKIFRRAFASRIYPGHIIKQMGITHVRGMLLYGPPGCGKTLIARQIGKVLNSHEPKIVNGPEVLDKYVGASEEKIRLLFADAEAEMKAEGDKSMLHTIIFDEMDAICKSRGSVRDGTGVSDSIVNQLLSKIDGVDSLNNILVIGMTNRKDMIDEAILRPGRLELHVEICLPDEAGRLQILEIKTASMKASQRLSSDAVDALPELAGRTKNFSGAELEGLVKSAASYALRRCVDVSDTSKIDTDAMRIVRTDFTQALDSGEAVAAFGAKASSLEPLYRNGIVDYGPQFREIDRAIKKLVEQTRTSTKTPLMTVLLEGRGGTGKTALAAHAAMTSEFPFVRLLSADAMIGFSESAKCQAIQKVFMDSYKSPLSIIVVDDVERLMEYTPVGPRFSNQVLQTLLVLLKKAPEEPDRRLLVIATTAIATHLEDLQLVDAFSISLRCPQLEEPAEIEAALAGLVPNPGAVAATVTKPLGIKQLLMVLEMSRGEHGEVDANDFAASLVQFLGV